LKITNIKTQVKHQDRVSIFVDDEYSFSLSMDQLLQFKLKKGLGLDEGQLKELVKASEEGKIRSKALEWLMMRPHSTREFKDYGYRKKIEPDLVERMIAEFTRKNYIDDYGFARWFAQSRIKKNKSKRHVVSELASKGIDRQIAHEVVEELGDDDESLKLLIEKLRTRSRYKEEKKLIAYLIGRGFSYSEVKSALSSDS